LLQFPWNLTNHTPRTIRISHLVTLSSLIGGVGAVVQLPFANRFAPLATNEEEGEDDEDMLPVGDFLDTPTASSAHSSQGRGKRRKSPKSCSTSTSSDEDVDEAVQALEGKETKEGWEGHDIPDSVLEDHEEVNKTANGRDMLTNDQLLQTAFHSAANSIKATALELHPRGPQGREGVISNKANRPDVLGQMPPSVCPKPGPVQPILPTHNSLE
jgi:hypothetical protein